MLRHLFAATAMLIATAAYADVGVGAGPTCDAGIGNSSAIGPVSAENTNGDQHAEASGTPGRNLYAEANAYASGIPCKWTGSASDTETLHVFGLQFNQLVSLTVTTSFSSSLQAYANDPNSWSDSNTWAILGAGIWGDRASEDDTLYYGTETRTSAPHILSTSFITSEWGAVSLYIGAQAWGAGDAGAVTSISSGSSVGPLFSITLAPASAGVLGLSYQLGGGPIVSLSSGTPEPATWALLLAGFGLVGAAVRRRRHSGANLRCS